MKKKFHLSITFFLIFFFTYPLLIVCQNSNKLLLGSWTDSNIIFTFYSNGDATFGDKEYYFLHYSSVLKLRSKKNLSSYEHYTVKISGDILELKSRDGKAYFLSRIKNSLHQEEQSISSNVGDNNWLITDLNQKLNNCHITLNNHNLEFRMIHKLEKSYWYYIASYSDIAVLLNGSFIGFMSKKPDYYYYELKFGNASYHLKLKGQIELISVRNFRERYFPVYIKSGNSISKKRIETIVNASYYLNVARLRNPQLEISQLMNPELSGKKYLIFNSKDTPIEDRKIVAKNLISQLPLDLDVFRFLNNPSRYLKEYQDEIQQRSTSLSKTLGFSKSGHWEYKKFIANLNNTSININGHKIELIMLHQIDYEKSLINFDSIAAIYDGKLTGVLERKSGGFGHMLNFNGVEYKLSLSGYIESNKITKFKKNRFPIFSLKNDQIKKTYFDLKYHDNQSLLVASLSSPTLVIEQILNKHLEAERNKVFSDDAMGDRFISIDEKISIAKKISPFLPLDSDLTNFLSEASNIDPIPNVYIRSPSDRVLSTLKEKFLILGTIESPRYRVKSLQVNKKIIKIDPKENIESRGIFSHEFRHLVDLKKEKKAKITIIATNNIGNKSQPYSLEITKIEQPKNFKAILLGVGSFENSDIPSLPSVDNDIKFIRNTLIRCNYKILNLSKSGKIKLNLRKSEFYRALESLANKVKREDLILIYFTGHGYMHQGKNGYTYYLMFKDSQRNNLITMIDQWEFFMLIYELFAQQNIILLIDTCHAGGIEDPLINIFTTKDWAKSFLDLSRIKLIAASSFYQPAYEGVFRERILDIFRMYEKKEFRLEDLISELGNRIINDKGQVQDIYYAGNLPGEVRIK